jgi:phospho-N-acetylmuramoyl-pentapeptide-transferase
MIITFLSTIQPAGQPIRSDGPTRHLFEKAGTPTMGGVLILASIIISFILWAKLTNYYVWISLFACIAFGLVGFLDDYKKIYSKSSYGLKVSTRIILQIVLAFIIVFLIYSTMPENLNSTINFPFFKNLIIDLGMFFFIFGIFIIVGSANAVNLTDGLDGLAIVPVMIVATTFAFIAYVAGNINFSEYLQINYIEGSGELSVFCGAIIGSALGFLWFNAPPAKVFMGDTGSLSLGGGIATLSIMTKHEIVLAIVGGLFVLETLSVIVQVISFKFTGKRIFQMAPLHHHFEKKGWAESTIVIRFWIITIVLALIGLATLKIR